MAKKSLQETIEETISPLIQRKPPPKKGKKESIWEKTTSLGRERLIPLSLIKPDPNQPRKSVNERGLNELAASIRQHGLLQSLTVEYMKEDGYFKLINGFRRYQAAGLAELKEVPCIIKDVTANERMEQQLVENLQREDLNPVEQAEGYKFLIDKYKYKQQDIAEKIGKDRSTISRILSLTKLPDDIKKECVTSHIDSTDLLLQVSRQRTRRKMFSLWKKIKEQGLTVREARRERKPVQKRPPRFRSRYKLLGGTFIVSITSNKSKVQRSELLQALRELQQLIKKAH